MKYNKSLLFTSLLVANTVLAPLVTAEETQTLPLSEIVDETTEQTTDLRNDPLSDKIGNPNSTNQGISKTDSSESGQSSTSSTIQEEKSSNTDSSIQEEVPKRSSVNNEETITTPSIFTESSESTTESQKNMREGENILSNWQYEETDNYVLLKKYTGNSTDIVVPGDINGKQTKLDDINSSVFPQIGDRSLTSFTVEKGANGTKASLVDSDLSHAFDGAWYVTSIDLSGLDTSNVENMSYMFYECQRLTKLNLDGLDTSSVKNMSYMFRYCVVLSNISIRHFDTSNVKDMSYMFADCTLLASIDLRPIDNTNTWNTSSVENMSYMFYNDMSLYDPKVNKFKTDRLKDISHMFERCTNLININIPEWSVGNIITMESMFYNCIRLRSASFDNWKLNSNVVLNNAFEVENRKVEFVLFTDDTSLLSYNYNDDGRIPFTNLKLDANGGKFKNGSSQILYFTAVANNTEKKKTETFRSFMEQNIPTRDRFTFAGWNPLLNNPESVINILDVVYKATWEKVVLDPNIPSDNVDNIKPSGELTSFGIAYMPKQFSIEATKLQDSGKQSIPIAKAERFDIAVRDLRDTNHSWTLKAQLVWDQGKELDGAFIQTTNANGEVTNNTNNGTDSFKNSDLVPLSNNEVKGQQSVTINSEGTTLIMEADSSQKQNGVYNYNFGDVSLEIQETKYTNPDTYSGHVEWILTDAP